jgi:leucyl aminopeptidase
MPLTIEASGRGLARSGKVLAIPTSPGRARLTLGVGADVLDGLGVDARAAVAREDAKGEAGEVVSIPVGKAGVDTVLLAGIGDGSPQALRRAASAVARRAKTSVSLGTTLAAGQDAHGVRAVAEALGLASYAFLQRKSDPKAPALQRATLIVDDPQGVQASLHRANVTVAAVHLARDLGQTPALEKSPEWMVEQAEQMAATAGIGVQVWDANRLAAEGFGGIMAVGRGSSRPPRLLELGYSPAGARRHVVLVGKGITFDTGGLSLKPNDGMVGMKTDMSGGAAVIGAMSALQGLSVSTRVTGLVPLAENMPGADATRPGDVITHYGGRTSEVLNTDAEGRLVLADALAYAIANLDPDVIVDIATLTGAATLGLGKRHGALFSTSGDLTAELLAAAEAGGERLWPMPLVESYRDALESPVADLRNIGDPNKHYSGGAIAAALFLREFVADSGVPWAHLDVAGPARAEADEHEVTKGPTGFGARTFLRWLEQAD